MLSKYTSNINVCYDKYSCYEKITNDTSKLFVEFNLILVN